MEHISVDLKKFDETNQLLKNIHLLTGMTVTLYNSKRLWVTSYPLYNCNFCKLLRSNTEYHMRCRANDTEAFKLCTEQKKMIVYKCFMGLYEIIVPLFDQDTIYGYLLLGQVLEDSDEAKKKCLENLRISNPNVPDEVLGDAIDTTPTISEEKLMAIAQMAHIYAEHISEKKLIENELSGLANLAATYIREHFTEKITNAELCYVFLCDRKKLASEFRKVHGMSIVDYTNNLRLRKARQMLQNNPDLNLNYLATTVGFSYQSYFSTLFYKKYGMSPTEMQKKYKEEMKNKEKEGENL